MQHFYYSGKQLFLILFLILGSTLKAAGFTVGSLRVNDCVAPMGIDTPQPRFSWNMQSQEKGQYQKAYRLIIASTSANAENGVGDVFDSKRIDSEQSSQICPPMLSLKSKTDYYWKVQVWNQDGTAVWSPVARFGVAMLSAADWTAEWIMAPNAFSAAEIELDEPVLSRYVRLKVSKIGVPVNEEGKWRLQLAEIEVYGLDERQNLATACKVTMTDEETRYKPLWQASNLTDGFKTSTAKSAGGSTVTYSSGNLSKPVYITIDLGSEMMVSRVKLYPRTDAPSKNDATKAGNFPADFEIQTKTTRDANYRICKKVSGYPTPQLQPSGENQQMPMFGTSFHVEKEIRSAKVYACGLGLFEMMINGEKATDHVLEPGESTYDKTVLYATYDITGLLKQGSNAVVVRTGNGFYNNPYTPTRYQVFSVTPYGPTRLLAQIEIVYNDGTKQIIRTGKDWKTTPSEITTTLWHGGEDFDARLTPEGIERADFAFEGWNNAIICNDPVGKLKAQFYPPTQVIETFKAVKVTSPEKGVYLIDFGRNYAGQYEFNLKAPAGTRIVLKRSDRLDENGRIWQYSDEWYQGVRRAVYESYIFKGDENGETWGPRFVYHGLRYLEISGLKEAPSPEQFTAKLIRAGIDRVGRFSCSDTLLNQISLITERSIEANIYNTLTDCPHIEKLGWLEVPNLMYNSISPVFDLSAWMPKISMDISDNQRSSGMVHTFCPDWGHTYGGEFGDDPTWAAATIMVPWQTYQTYGNTALLEEHYDVMKKLMDYYASRSSGYLLHYGLGDWGAYDKTTSRDYVVSCTYYQVAGVMKQIADILKKSDDASKYDELTRNIGQAIIKTYYHADKRSFDSGSQAANAIALYVGLVPEEDREGVLRNLVKSVADAGYHLTTGEVGLKPLFLSLAANGYNDVVYKMTQQKDMPGYGYFIEQGCTSLPEFWDMYRSQMHCMLGHIEGWFYAWLGGIRNTGVAYKQFEIAPYFAPELDGLNASTSSVYGKITSSWKRLSDGRIEATVEVPCNSQATLVIPGISLDDVKYGGRTPAPGDGILKAEVKDGKVNITLASGTYTFEFPQPSYLSLIRLNELISMAESVKESNTVSGWDELQEALKEACKLLEDSSNLTAEKISRAEERLENALNQTVELNLALGKQVYYSTSMESYGWMAYKLTDGDTLSSTGYSSKASKTNTTEYAGVDLGRPLEFNTVKLYPRKYTESSFPKDFEIQISEDKQQWETVYQTENYLTPSPVDAVQTFDFKTVKARYVRIYATKLACLKTDNNNYYLQLMEMTVEKH